VLTKEARINSDRFADDGCDSDFSFADRAGEAGESEAVPDLVILVSSTYSCLSHCLQYTRRSICLACITTRSWFVSYLLHLCRDHSVLQHEQMKEAAYCCNRLPLLLLRLLPTASCSTLHRLMLGTPITLQTQAQHIMQWHAR
jgi:hypothetical protein